MISLDKGLLGKGQLGDVVERHKKYGEFVEKLDIIVFSKKGFAKYQISDNVTAYPTNSCCKLKYAGDARKIGKKLFGENKYNLIVTQEPFLTGLVGTRLKKQFGNQISGWIPPMMETLSVSQSLNSVKSAVKIYWNW